MWPSNVRHRKADNYIKPHLHTCVHLMFLQKSKYIDLHLYTSKYLTSVTGKQIYRSTFMCRWMNNYTKRILSAKLLFANLNNLNTRFGVYLLQTLTSIPTLYILADHKIYHFQILWENTKHWEDIRPHIHVTYSGILLHTTEDQEHMWSKS